MPSFADVIERVRGAVVSVKVSASTVADDGDDPREQFRRGLPGAPNNQLDRFFRQFRGDGGPRAPQRRSMSQGWASSSRPTVMS